MARVMLVDGDIVIFRAGMAAQHVWYDIYPKGEPQPIDRVRYKVEVKNHGYLDDEELEVVPNRVIEPLANHLHNAKTIIFDMIATLRPEEVTIALSGPKNFRYEIASDYKANRDPKQRPVYEQELKQYLTSLTDVAQLPSEVEVSENCEADDVLGIRQTYHGMDSIICSIDKDLKQIPGCHYNFVTGEQVCISIEGGNRNFFTQLLVGDNVDNIHGLQGVGKVTAGKVLDGSNTYPDMFTAVCREYKKRVSPTTEDELVALTQRILKTGRLLWIQRDGNQMWSSEEEVRRYLDAV